MSPALATMFYGVSVGGMDMAIYGIFLSKLSFMQELFHNLKITWSGINHSLNFV